MTRECKYCGQTLNTPNMSESEYRDLLREIGGHRGSNNRIVAWIESVEREDGIVEAMFTLQEYL